jgi:hypothetical protein
MASAPKFFTALIVGALILFGFGSWVIFDRRAEDKVLAKQNEALSVPAVAVVHPSVTPPEDELVLPGTKRLPKAGIYARTSGYLKARHADLARA